ncbi:hypothetical protein Tco_1405716 [Tanacetum coccineum]
MEEFATNDKSNYYSGITSIMVNGKRAYELKGKILDDLRDNDFSGTNREDAVEHIEYFLKIVDPINLPNVNYERLTLSVFPISLIKNNGKVGVADKEFSDAENANNDDKQEITKIYKIETNLFDYETPLCTEFKEFNFLLKVDPGLFTHDIERTKTYKDYENKLNDELKEPWSEDGDYEWYNELEDRNLKEEALKQKAIYEKSWGDASQGVMNFCAWLKKYFVYFRELDYKLWVKLQDYWCNVNDHKCSPFSDWRNHIHGPYANYYINFLDKEEHGLINDYKWNFVIRRFEMIKYSFCTYQEIFRRMDEGWMVTHAE